MVDRDARIGQDRVYISSKPSRNTGLEIMRMLKNELLHQRELSRGDMALSKDLKSTSDTSCALKEILYQTSHTMWKRKNPRPTHYSKELKAE